MSRADVISLIVLLSLPIIAACACLKGLPAGFDADWHCLDTGKCYQRFCISGTHEKVWSKVVEAGDRFYIVYNNFGEGAETTVCLRKKTRMKIRSIR